MVQIDEKYWRRTGRISFSLKAFIALTVVAGIWLALSYLDATLSQGRIFIAAEPEIVNKVGEVKAIVLYKSRYFGVGTDPQGCRAEYFLLVFGAAGKAMNLRVRACGTIEDTYFIWMER